MGLVVGVSEGPLQGLAGYDYSTCLSMRAALLLALLRQRHLTAQIRRPLAITPVLVFP